MNVESSGPQTQWTVCERSAASQVETSPQQISSSPRRPIEAHRAAQPSPDTSRVAAESPKKCALCERAQQSPIRAPGAHGSVALNKGLEHTNRAILNKRFEQKLNITVRS